MTSDLSDPPPLLLKFMNKRKGFNLLQKDFFPNSMENLVMWIFSLSFTGEKTPQNNFSGQNFSVENNYFEMRRKSKAEI